VGVARRRTVGSRALALEPLEPLGGGEELRKDVYRIEVPEAGGCVSPGVDIPNLGESADQRATPDRNASTVPRAIGFEGSL
jgi:hypothetical protein